MGRLPALRPDKNACESPHLVVLGAGASRAACPTGDVAGRQLPMMDDLVSTLGLEATLTQAGIDFAGKNFETVYEGLLARGKDPGLVGVLEDNIRAYFTRLRLPPTATVYDQLLLSLRSKDVVATFNWDPLLAQAYQRNSHLKELPRMLFLHGNVACGICSAHRKKGFLGTRCDVCENSLERTPLLYPIGKKDYATDPFIANEWSELRDVLDVAYILTIFGYAAPASDAEAKEMMLQAWRANETRELAEIDIIDIKSRDELERTWKPFFVRTHFGVSTTPTWLFTHARRSCDHFAMATLQQRPCRDNPVPLTLDLSALQAWAEPLIAQEIALRDEGRPFPC